MGSICCCDRTKTKKSSSKSDLKHARLQSPIGDDKSVKSVRVTDGGKVHGHAIFSPTNSESMLEITDKDILTPVQMQHAAQSHLMSISIGVNPSLQTTISMPGYISYETVLSKSERELEDVKTDDYYTQEDKGLFEEPIPSSNSPQMFSWKKGEILGQGAFGVVYLCLNESSGHLMAVKQIQVDPAQKDKTESLRREIGVLSALQHPNIVQYFGTEYSKNVLNVFLEFVSGGSIATLLKKFGKFNEKLVQLYSRQILLGLEYLHMHRIVHRDIKGGNILVDNSGVCKLADFGASRRLSDTTIERPTHSLHGTPYWMAPEVIKQTGHGRQADIWSMGCTVIEMLTGRPPWYKFQTQVSALFHIASTNEPPEFPEDISDSGKDFILRCLERDPRKRPNASRLLQHPFIKDIEVYLKKQGPLSASSVNLIPKEAVAALRRDSRSSQSAAQLQNIVPTVPRKTTLTKVPTTDHLKPSIAKKKKRSPPAPRRTKVSPNSTLKKSPTKSSSSEKPTPSLRVDTSVVQSRVDLASPEMVENFLMTERDNLVKVMDGDFYTSFRHYRKNYMKIAAPRSSQNGGTAARTRVTKRAPATVSSVERPIDTAASRKEHQDMEREARTESEIERKRRNKQSLWESDLRKELQYQNTLNRKITRSKIS
eukprot:180826_1